MLLKEKGDYVVAISLIKNMTRNARARVCTNSFSGDVHVVWRVVQSLVTQQRTARNGNLLVSSHRHEVTVIECLMSSLRCNMHAFSSPSPCRLSPGTHQQQRRSNVRLCRRDIQLCSIWQCCRDIVAGVDGILGTTFTTWFEHFMSMRSWAPSTPATMSKQQATLSKLRSTLWKQISTLLPQTATMPNEYRKISSFRQSRMLLRHCCRFWQHSRKLLRHVATPISGLVCHL